MLPRILPRSALRTHARRRLCSVHMGALLGFPVYTKDEGLLQPLAELAPQQLQGSGADASRPELDHCLPVTMGERKSPAAVSSGEQRARTTNGKLLPHTILETDSR
jgi:hypothetical protein